jgi:HEAT repeat protein
MESLVNRLVLFAFCCMFGLVNGQTPDTNANRARSIIREGIESKDPDVRIQALVATGMVGRDERGESALQGALKDKDVQVRIAAINALADLKAVVGNPALENVMRGDDVPEVRFAAAKALYTLMDPAGKAALLEVYEGKIDPNSNYFRKRARGIKREFHSVQSGTMFLVGTGVGFAPVPGAGAGFSAMMELVSDPELSPRAHSLLILGKEKSPEATQLIERGLTDKDWSVRAAAAQLVAHTARTELRESLLPLFDDKKEKVRFRASGAYLHLYFQEKK